MKPLLSALLLAGLAGAQPTVVEIPGASPIVTFRVVFKAGSALDAKPGTAALVASMLSSGGTRELTYKQLVDRFFPMAVRITAQVDKEMTTFMASTHRDNLDAFYKLFSAMLLDPGWRKEDFERLRDDQINYLRVTLRGSNDEELGKEVLYEQIYKGTSYGHVNQGSVAGLKGMTIGDLQSYYAQNFTQRNLTIGIAGGYPSGFADRLRHDFADKLKAGETGKSLSPKPTPIEGRNMYVVDKATRSVAYSFGFPIDVKRGEPDYPALLVAQAYFGQHRVSIGRLYDRMREIRGLNYGDYAYIEYFPRGMFTSEPPQNVARPSQIFQVWIRPVEPPTAVFALRLALFELDHLIKEGVTEEQFQASRSYVTKFANLLIKNDDAQLGYKIDSLFYGTPNYPDYLRQALAKVTREDVNKAIRAHLQSANMDIVVVTSGAEALKAKFLSGEPSPMKYNSPKPDALMAEDKIVEAYPLKLANVKILPGDQVFE